MRIQKVLSAAGVASRRQVEAWLVQGRLTVNGQPAAPGQALGPKDVVALDGRRLRLAATSPDRTRVIAYHRSPGEPARAADAPEGTTPVEDRLPKVKGARWLPLGAMAPSDGGLELFTTDGALRAAVSKKANAHETHYSVRVRRLPDEAELARLGPTAAAGDPPFEVLKCGADPGEGSNAWINVTTRGARARDLRAALAAIGVDVNALRNGRRRFAYGCMDWSERRPHLAGALGAAVAERCIALGWLARQKHSRALSMTEAGQRELHAWLHTA